MRTMVLGLDYVCESEVAVWATELKMKSNSDDPRIIADNEGVAVIGIADGRSDWDARLILKGKRWFIFENERNRNLRRDYSIAHELMHRELHLRVNGEIPHNETFEDLCDIGARVIVLGW